MLSCITFISNVCVPVWQQSFYLHFDFFSQSGLICSEHLRLPVISAQLWNLTVCLFSPCKGQDAEAAAGLLPGESPSPCRCHQDVLSLSPYVGVEGGDLQSQSGGGNGGDGV